MRRGVVRAAAAGALVAASCANRPPSVSPVRAPAYAYAIAPPPDGSWLLKIEATFEGAPSAHLSAPFEGALRDVSIVDGAVARPAARDRNGGWVAEACRDRCTLTYTVDLDALASSCGRMDCGRRVGEAVLGTASTWMLRPEPPGDAAIRLRVSGGDPARFATGLRPDPAGGYVFRARELGEASYTAFGSFRKARLDLAGATVQVALLGAPLAMGDAATVDWIRDSAACVASLFGRFPADATVFVVPVAGASHVVFGRVMSLSGASVVLLFGSATPASDKPREWVVVHELFHLGCPSFVDEGHWLEEGLATYYEPILRARAGWMSEDDLWAHFREEMARGLRKEGEPPSLEERDDIDSTYWGGALFALLADVRIRELTGGARSLDDVLRAVLARDGNATHAALVADFVRVGDEATGTTALAELYASWVLQGENVDLDALWQKLGVERGRLRGDAAQAGLRRAIGAAGPGRGG